MLKQNSERCSHCRGAVLGKRSSPNPASSTFSRQGTGAPEKKADICQRRSGGLRFGLAPASHRHFGGLLEEFELQVRDAGN